MLIDEARRIVHLVVHDNVQVLLGVVLRDVGVGEFLVGHVDLCGYVFSGPKLLFKKAAGTPKSWWEGGGLGVEVRCGGAKVEYRNVQDKNLRASAALRHRLI
jgi:hypothetical protein